MHKSFIKGFLVTLLISFFAGSIFAAQNVVDVFITENVEEYVKYNPLGSTSGLYVDSNENRSVYLINGEIIVSNNHNTQPVNNIVLNITGTSNIYNIVNSAGALGYVSVNGADSVILVIPDLAAGANSTFTYSVNTTNIAPPLNFSTSYSDSKIFAGLALTITDTIENTLNSTDYPENCIYNLNITQYAMELNSSGLLFNMTYDATSIAGTDAGNVGFSADNRTLSWDVLAGGCLYSTNTTNISYDAQTPVEVNTAADYGIVNTTIKYQMNDTFSKIGVATINGLLDLDLQFDKYVVNVLTGDNATWRVNASVVNPTNITVNLTDVTLWVSVRNSEGNGFSSPGSVDNDSMSGAALNKTFFPGQLLNNTLPNWEIAGNEWFFNSTFSSSPIVWMDMNNFIVNDGVQLTNRTISYNQNSVFIKEVYIATGYWIQLSRNITRLADNKYNIFIRVNNLGTSSTPNNKVVQVYNFLQNTFSLNSSFVYSTSTWYNSAVANQTLNDPIYNGTMYQFAISGNNNPSNSSLDAYGGALNANNSWTVTYNVTGSGEFNFDDLFLTGVDPLNVESYGSTQAVTIDGIYGFVSSKIEIIFGIAAVAIGALVLFI